VGRLTIPNFLVNEPDFEPSAYNAQLLALMLNLVKNCGIRIKSLFLRIMVKFKYLSVILLFVFALSSCKKDEDAEKQITKYIQQNNINAVKDPSGLYYQIIKPGSGTTTINSNTNITIKYEGKLLDGTVIDNGGGKENTFRLGDLIEGWKIGIPKIQKGGEIRLIIPPTLGYGSRNAGPIPANSVLDFNIQLTNAQ